MPVALRVTGLFVLHLRHENRAFKAL